MNFSCKIYPIFLLFCRSTLVKSASYELPLHEISSGAVSLSCGKNVLSITLCGFVLINKILFQLQSDVCNLKQSSPQVCRLQVVLAKLRNASYLVFINWTFCLQVGMSHAYSMQVAFFRINLSQ